MGRTRILTRRVKPAPAALRRVIIFSAASNIASSCDPYLIVMREVRRLAIGLLGMERRFAPAAPSFKEQRTVENDLQSSIRRPCNVSEPFCSSTLLAD